MMMMAGKGVRDRNVACFKALLFCGYLTLWQKTEVEWTVKACAYSGLAN